MSDTNENAKIKLDMGDKLMILMDRAWSRGISTTAFRQCDMSDLKFIMDMDIMRDKKREDMKHEQKVREAMQAIGVGRHR